MKKTTKRSDNMSREVGVRHKWSECSLCVLGVCWKCSLRCPAVIMWKLFGITERAHKGIFYHFGTLCIIGSLVSKKWFLQISGHEKKNKHKKWQSIMSASNLYLKLIYVRSESVPDNCAGYFWWNSTIHFEWLDFQKIQLLLGFILWLGPICFHFPIPKITFENTCHESQPIKVHIWKTKCLFRKEMNAAIFECKPYCSPIVQI